jgi:hypothetical protein
MILESLIYQWSLILVGQIIIYQGSRLDGVVNLMDRYVRCINGKDIAMDI